MTHTRKNEGVCSRDTTVTLEDGVITDIVVTAGCDGNLKGVCELLRGMPAEEAIPRIQGITCGSKGTSCPAQIALCLQEALDQG